MLANPLLANLVRRINLFEIFTLKPPLVCAGSGMGNAFGIEVKI